MIKYIVFDLLEKQYLLYNFDTKTRDWVDFGTATEFVNEEIAWKYAGIYCTVIKIRTN